MKVERIDYTALAFAKLKDALDGYEAFFKHQVEQDEAVLLSVNDGESYAIIRTEQDDVHGLVMVICCYQGKRVHEFTRLMIEKAKSANYTGIRIHTKKPGIGRIAQSLGFNELERVYFNGF